MIDEEAQLRVWTEEYLRRSAPVRWVNWILKCPDPDAKKRLKSVLFEDGVTRDLTDLKVAGEVATAILNEPCVMELVIADLAEELENLEKQEE